MHRDFIRVSCFEARPLKKVVIRIPDPTGFCETIGVLTLREDDVFFKFTGWSLPKRIECIDCFADISRRKLMKNYNRKKRCLKCENHYKRYLKIINRKISVTQTRHKRRALLQQSEVGYVPPVSDLVLKQGGRCAICNGKFSERFRPTLDHIIPISKGGPHIASNVQALCRPCNGRKGAKILPQTVNNRKAEP